MVDAEPVSVRGGVGTYADPGYAVFHNTLDTRRAMVYQAANDGMVHAFDAASGMRFSFTDPGQAPQAVLGIARAYGGEKVSTVVASNVVCGPIEAALVNGMLAGDISDTTRQTLARATHDIRPRGDRLQTTGIATLTFSTFGVNGDVPNFSGAARRAAGSWMPSPRARRARVPRRERWRRLRAW